MLVQIHSDKLLNFNFAIEDLYGGNKIKDSVCNKTMLVVINVAKSVQGSSERNAAHKYWSLY